MLWLHALVCFALTVAEFPMQSKIFVFNQSVILLSQGSPIIEGRMTLAKLHTLPIK